MNGLLSDEEALRRFNAIESGDQPWYTRALPMEGRATILPFMDSMPGSVFNKREWAIPGLLAEAINAVTAPRRALLDPQFDQGKEGVNFALNVMGGGVGGSRAMPNPTGQGGKDVAMFAGKKAQTADFNKLVEFQKMQEQRVPVQQSWAETGWMQGAEGKPRFEISDDASLISPMFNPAEQPTATFIKDLVPMQDVLIHPELYKAYPQLRNYGVGFLDDLKAVGAYSDKGKAFYLGSEYKQSFADNPNSLRSVLLHEAQHAIQSLENFERGGNLDIAKKVLTTQAQAELSGFPPNISHDFDKTLANLSYSSSRLYMQKLDNLANAENIKPSSIRNLSDWYQYSDQIVRQFGQPPTKPGAARDEFYRNAAKFIRDKTLEQKPNLANYNEFTKDQLTKAYKNSGRQLDKIRPEYQKFNETVKKYKKLGEKTDYEIYERLAGEAEARLTEKRINKSPQERSATYPFEDLDVPYNELLYRSLLD